VLSHKAAVLCSEVALFYKQAISNPVAMFVVTADQSKQDLEGVNNTTKIASNVIAKSQKHIEMHYAGKKLSENEHNNVAQAINVFKNNSVVENMRLVLQCDNDLPPL